MKHLVFGLCKAEKLIFHESFQKKFSDVYLRVQNLILNTIFRWIVAFMKDTELRSGVFTTGTRDGPQSGPREPDGELNIFSIAVD